MDRHSTGKAWMPDSRSLLLAANDGTVVGYWLQTVGGAAKRVHLGAISPKADISVGSKGKIAFTASSASHAVELYFMSALDAALVKLTSLQLAEDGLDLGKSETVAGDQRQADGGWYRHVSSGICGGQEGSPSALYSRQPRHGILGNLFPCRATTRRTRPDQRPTELSLDA